MATRILETAEEGVTSLGEMKTDRVDSALIRKLYSEAKSQLENPLQQLRWVEGIMPLFKDRDWATQQFDELTSTFSAGKEAARLRASRQSRLRTGLY